jgi:riboflavin kinase / FMN adenylyltransferase
LKVYHSLREFNPVENLVVTIGTFDGVHLGHRKLINTMKQEAAAIKGETLILTFFPHPRMVLYPDEHGVQLLTTIREKIQLLDEAGLDHLVIHAFDKEFSELSARDFIKSILDEKLHTTKLVIGHDHRFGKQREGGIELLLAAAPEHGFQVEKIPEADVNNITVSSTRIRNALKLGKVETAKAFLGRPYSLTGMIVHGKKLGRTIGYPTANVYIPEDYKLIPAEGVYVVEALLESNKYFGLLSIGRRPTIEENGEISIEVFLFDFNDEIYGMEITLKLLHFLRADMKFETVEQLTARIKEDVDYAVKYLATR